MKKLFDYIASKARKRKAFEKSEEFRFFVENRHTLISLPKFVNLFDYEKDTFQVMRANIVLTAYLNKTKMEEAANKLQANKDIESFNETISKLSYFEYGNDKIYIPFFDVSLNRVYLNEPEKLMSYPYSELKKSFEDTLIDPFDTYGSRLFDSNFFHLVKVASNDKETAFFHFDSNTIYFVNEQGRLDADIVLFDRHIHHPNYENMLERIKPVIDAYFAFDREAFINALFENGFISSRLLRSIRFHDYWAKR